MANFSTTIAVDLTNFQNLTSGQTILPLLSIGGFATFNSSTADGFSAAGTTVMAGIFGTPPTGTVTEIYYVNGPPQPGVTPASPLITITGLSTPAGTALSLLTATSQATSQSGMAALLSGADMVVGSAFDDTLMGGAGFDSIDGGQGTDTASYVTSADGVQVSLAEGEGYSGDATGDTLFSIENLTGSAFNDVLYGSSGVANVLIGGDGNDTLAGLSGADTLNGGAGTDTVEYSNSASKVTINLLAGTAAGGDAQGDTLTSIENVTGSAFGDALAGDGNANFLSGGAGNDYLLGGGGADSLFGGDGLDTVSYATSAAGVNLQLFIGNGSGINGDAQGDFVSSIENLTGSAFADILIGDTGANRLSGLAGDDRMQGGGERDVIDGGAGIDLLAGDDGNDALRGGDGNDTISGGAGNDSLDGGAGIDAMTGGDGNDTYFVDSAQDTITELDGGGVDRVTSSVGYTLSAFVDNLILTGDAGRGYGNDQDNVIRGNVADNVLVGSGGADRLIGGDGGDVLIGGAGNDQLYGGEGADRFVFTSLATDGVDRISDWDASDVIVVNGDGFGISDLALDVINGASIKGAAGGDTDFFFYAAKGGKLYFHDGETDTFTQFATLTNGPDSLSVGDFDLLLQ